MADYCFPVSCNFLHARILERNRPNSCANANGNVYEKYFLAWRALMITYFGSGPLSLDKKNLEIKEVKVKVDKKIW